MIRTVKEEDLQSLLELYRYLNPDDPVLGVDASLQRVWRQIISEENIHCFVMLNEKVFLASCVLAIIPNLTRGARPFAVIQNVVTHPDFRGQGFARQVLEHAHQVAWEQNCYQILLQTGRPETHAFYRKLGYRDDIKTGFVLKPE